MGRALALGICGAFPALASAVPPANDDIAGAIALPVRSTFNTVYLTGATVTAADPSCGQTQYQSIWYRYDSPVDQVVEANLSRDLHLGDFTTVGPFMLVASGQPGALALEQCSEFVANDGSYGRHVSFEAQAGRSYYFMIYAQQEQAQIAAAFDVLPHAFPPPQPPPPPPPPANDDFEDATRITRLPWAATVDLGAATPDTDAPVDLNSGRSIWYEYTPTSSLMLDALFTGKQAGYVVVTELDANHEPVREIESLDTSWDPSRVRFAAKAGVTYSIAFAYDLGSSASRYTNIALRPSPAPNQVTLTPAKTIKVYSRLALYDGEWPTLGWQTRVSFRLDVTCKTPVARLRLLVDLPQYPQQATWQEETSIACANGRGSARIDVPMPVFAGSALLTLHATDFNTNTDVTTGPLNVTLTKVLWP